MLSLRSPATGYCETDYSPIGIRPGLHPFTRHHPWRSVTTPQRFLIEFPTDQRTDIHPRNLTYSILDLDSWPTAYVYRCLGSPIKHAISRVDDSLLGPEAPSYAVLPAHLFQLDNYPRGDLAILDFGQASLASEPRTEWLTPIVLQAPEALLGELVDLPADIWAFACTIFVIFDNTALFGSGISTADEVLAEIVDTLGPLPDSWWQKWKYRAEFYEEDGRKRTEDLTEEYQEVRPLAVRIRRIRSSPPAPRNIEQLDEEDLAGLQDLLEHCFKYKPEEKIAAKEILKLR